MTPLSYLSVLEVSGADASRFLQSQLTAQLAGLTAPGATYSAYCTPKGQVIATLLLTPHVDQWLVVVESTLLATLVERLQRFILRDDVLLRPLPEQSVLAMDPMDTLPPDLILLQPRVIPFQYALTAMRSPDNPHATAQWRRKELLYGISWLNQANSEKYIPQMLGLDSIGAVSFAKGCYPGQEIIARARHLGEVKRRPHILNLEGTVQPDLNSPCFIHAAGGQIQATLVECVVAEMDDEITVLAVSAMKPADAVSGVEQNGLYWKARRVLRQQIEQ